MIAGGSVQGVGAMRLFWRTARSAVIGVVLLQSLNITAHGKKVIHLNAAEVDYSFQQGLGACNCLRWSVRVQGLGGQIETREFLISTEALVKFISKTWTGDFAYGTSETSRIGAIKVLLKRAHIGLGWDGVEIGNEQDLSYTKILRTGLFAFANIVRNEAVRVDFESGYSYEQMHINLSDDPYVRHLMPQRIALDWNKGKWQGDLSADLAFDPTHPAADTMSYGANTMFRYEVFNIKKLNNIGFGVGAEVDVEHDPFRSEYGLHPTSATFMVTMDLRWDPNAWRFED